MCNQSFEKTKGIIAHAIWYCSIKCCDSDPKTKGLRDLNSKGIEFYKNERESEDSDEVDPDDFEL